MFRRGGWLIPCAVAALLAAQVPAHAELQLLLRERGQHLEFVSSLPPGRHPLGKVRGGILPVEGELTVEPGEGPLRKVRAFKVHSWGKERPAPEDVEQLLFGPRRAGFSVSLEPSPVSPEKFSLYFRVGDGSRDAVVNREAHLRFNGREYHLAISAEGASSAPAACGTLVEMMLANPLDYRALEEFAAECSLPGFQFVPESRFSPRVIDLALGKPIELAAAPDRADWGRLVRLLDHPRYPVREAAAAELRAAGGELLNFLRSLPSHDLSIEQRVQLRGIVRAVVAPTRKEPLPLPLEQVRDLQRDKPAAWLAELLLCSDAKHRNWAWGQLRTRPEFADFPLSLPEEDAAAWRAKALEGLRKRP